MYLDCVRRVHVSTAAVLGVAVAGCNLILGGYKVGSGGSASSLSSTSTLGTSATNGTMSTGTGMTGVVVSPSPETLLASTTLTFAATLNGVAATVTWSVDEPTGGTVTAGGTYTAPAMPGTFHLRATNQADSTFAEATINVMTTAAPIGIAPAGNVNAPTGFGTQSHLAYAAGSNEWWLFYDEPGGAHLATMHSKSFATWTAGEGAVLSMGHSGEGRDLAVASRTVNGHDVVHVTVGAPMLGRYHVRAVLTDGHIAFDAPAIVNTNGSYPPDGSNVVILGDGTVIDSTGYQNTPQTPPLSPCGNGDVDIFTANAKEDGMTSFSGLGFSEQVIWCVGNTVNARKLIEAGSDMVAVYEDGASNPNPVNILTSLRRNDGTWLPGQPPAGPAVKPPTAFSTDQTFGLDDWNATVLGSDVHAVRRIGQAFEHQVFTAGSQSWAPGPAIPPRATVGDSGLFLAPYGDGLILAAVSPDTGNPILYTAFDGAQWSNWATVVLAHTPRTYLSGYAPGRSTKPALLWTEGAQVMGALLP